MSYVVHIKNNSTDEVREILFNEPYDEFSEFMWSEGNYSCDCNRSAFFGVRDSELAPCGDGLFSVVDVHNEDGTRDEEMQAFLA